jgi:hypothetical protein
MRRISGTGALVSCLSGLLGLLLAGAADAQGSGSCGNTSLGDYAWSASGQTSKANNCQPPNGFRCYAPENTGYFVEKIDPACDPSAGPCAVKIHVTATIPGVRDMVVEDQLGSSLTPWAEWYPCTGASCAMDTVCGVPGFGGQINFDNLDTWLQKALSCAHVTAQEKPEEFGHLGRA